MFEILTFSSHSKSKCFLNPDDMFVGKANKKNSYQEWDLKPTPTYMDQNALSS